MTSTFSRRDFLVASSLAASAFRVATSAVGAELGALASVMRPVSQSQVKITDPFWRSKVEKVATATLRACIHHTEVKTARIRNFERAAQKQGEHEGTVADDSDVYKALEAIAYSLKNRPDPALEAKADEWIDKIAAAQLPDGYLNTYYTLHGLAQRWTDMGNHEDYCAGHLIEAAVAYCHSTGKRKLLGVAIRFADHIDATFRAPNRHWVSGHEEIELALMKLYHLTGHDRYLKLAEWFLEQRGHGYGKGANWTEMGPAYCQDALPVKQQRQITGHAVRAMYLYTGAADVAAVTRDLGYRQAMKAVWEDVVHRNMYLTGGIGSSGTNEGFSENYDLPNAQAYCETCASVGMVLWNQRMNGMTGEAQYIDILERCLYNGALAGLGLSGDRFFYTNPLAASARDTPLGKPGRQEWFGTACCPANIARLVASIGGYLYATSTDGLWVNLFSASSALLKVGQAEVLLRTDGQYPWNGEVRISIDPARSTRFALHLRIPGWAKNVVVPGDLYRFTQEDSGRVEILLNGKPAQYREQKGYAVLERTWAKGDVVELRLPMPVRAIAARQEVKANRDRIALQRGPLVYCVEGADNAGTAWDFIVPESATFTPASHRVLDEPVWAIRSEARALSISHQDVALEPRTVTAIPYYTWANRENYEMQVWLPTKIKEVRINA